MALAWVLFNLTGTLVDHDRPRPAARRHRAARRGPSCSTSVPVRLKSTPCEGHRRTVLGSQACLVRKGASRRNLARREALRGEMLLEAAGALRADDSCLLYVVSRGEDADTIWLAGCGRTARRTTPRCARPASRRRSLGRGPLIAGMDGRASSRRWAVRGLTPKPPRPYAALTGADPCRPTVPHGVLLTTCGSTNCSGSRDRRPSCRCRQAVAAERLAGEIAPVIARLT